MGLWGNLVKSSAVYFVLLSTPALAQEGKENPPPPTDGRPIIVTGTRPQKAIANWTYYDRLGDRNIVSMKNFGSGWTGPNYAQHPPVSRPVGDDQVVTVIVPADKEDEAKATAEKQSEAIARLRDMIQSLQERGVKIITFMMKPDDSSPPVQHVIYVDDFARVFLKTDFVLTSANYGINRAGSVVYNDRTGRYTSYINYEHLKTYADHPNLDDLFYYTLHEVGHVSPLGNAFYKDNYRDFSAKYDKDPKYRGLTPYFKTNTYYRNEYGYFAINERFANNIAQQMATAMNRPIALTPAWGY